MLNKERGLVNPHDLIGPGKFRLGTHFVKHGELDPRSEENILAIRSLLEEGGIVFLNDHKDAFGIVVAGATLAEYLRINRLTGPAALKVVRNFIYGPYISRISKMPGLDVDPVPRGEEIKKAKKREFKLMTKLVKRFEKEGYSQVEAISHAVEIAREAPILYEYTMKELFDTIDSYKKKEADIKDKPFNATMIALFGSRKKFAKEEAVRSGLIELLQTGVWYVPTFSRKKRRIGRLFSDYTIEVGKPMRFEPGTDKETIAKALTLVYLEFEIADFLVKYKL